MKIDADKNISLESDQAIKKVAERKESFQNKVLLYNSIACQSGDGILDSKTAISESQDNLVALGAQGGLQEMLVAQMTSIHLLQQQNISLATRSIHFDFNYMQFYTNSAIKLANCFTQQASLLARLQGEGCQKIIIERVVVNKGGQAAVGIVNGGGGRSAESKNENDLL